MIKGIVAAGTVSVMVLAAASAAAASPAAAPPPPARAPVTAYVVNFVSGTVTPIRTANNSTGRPIRVGRDPGAIAITPNGSTAYLDNQSGGVIPIRLATNTPGRAIRVGGTLLGALAITPNGRTVYVAHIDGNTVTPIRVATNTAGRAIKAGPIPGDIEITRNARSRSRPPRSPSRSRRTAGPPMCSTWAA